ncbi:hypothetical protein AAZX31_12G167000 [Glycine max]|nr:hypothetical protein GLYMA_12G177625v4 [Glycine max]KAH1143701.1 hypothetical protein GYH30_034099 [Glycine max]
MIGENVVIQNLSFPQFLYSDNTRMKGIEAAIQAINTTLKKMVEDAELRHSNYMQMRSTGLARMDHFETQLGFLHLKSILHGSENSLPSHTAQPFQIRNIKLDFPRFDGFDV